MNLLKPFLVIVASFMALNVQASYSLGELEKSYLECSIKLDNTGAIDEFDLCTNKVLEGLTSVISNERIKKNNYKKNEWVKINTAIKNHLESCEANARKSQKNSTIKKDILSCRFFGFRSLATEAERLNSQ